MPLTDLLQAMEDEAREELTELDRDTAAEAAALVARAHSEARALMAELTEAPVPTARRDAERTTALARLAAAAALRVEREGAYSTVLDGARAALAALRGDDRYPQLFGALIAESRAALPAATVLRIDPRDTTLAAPLTDGLQLEPVLETWGGVELASTDGRIVRNTLEERLANAEPLLRRCFAAKLTSSTPPAARVAQ